MRTFSLRGGLVIALALLIALAGRSEVALAHAELVSSTPAAGATLDKAPERVVAVFSGELKAEGSLLKVTDSKGAVVDAGNSALDRSDAQRKTLSVGLKANLPADTYTIAWTAVAADGHTESGSFTFKIAGAAAPAAAPAAPAAPATAPGNLPATGATDTLPLVALLVGLLAIALGALLRRA